jgi:hypothetical protein
MAITEGSRNELHNALTRHIGEDAAATLMEMLPPVGWADVATKRDLDQLDSRLDSRLDARFDVLRAEHANLVTHKDLRHLTYTILAFNLTLVLALVGAAGLN